MNGNDYLYCMKDVILFCLSFCLRLHFYFFIKLGPKVNPDCRTYAYFAVV